MTAEWSGVKRAHSQLRIRNANHYILSKSHKISSTIVPDDDPSNFTYW